MRREEQVTVQGPAKMQQPDGMSHSRPFRALLLPNTPARPLPPEQTALDQPGGKALSGLPNDCMLACPELSSGGSTCTAHAPLAHCALLLPRVAAEHPNFYFLQENGLEESKDFGHKNCINPLLPTNVAQQRAQYHWHPLS